MDTADEQRACIKFCVKNGKTGAETLQMLRTAFSDDCLSQAVVYNDGHLLHPTPRKQDKSDQM
jgi:hypothetical protein